MSAEENQELLRELQRTAKIQSGALDRLSVEVSILARMNRLTCTALIDLCMLAGEKVPDDELERAAEAKARVTASGGVRKYVADALEKCLTESKKLMAAKELGSDENSGS